MDDSIEEAFIIAVVAKDPHSCGALVNRCNINISNSRGWTPLHFASRYNSIACAEILLDHGADTNAKDCNGATPSFYSSTQDMFDLLKHY